MQEKYQISQHKIYKALIRPVLYLGVPLGLLFCISAGLFIIGMFISPLLWFTIPIVVFSLGLLTRKDPFFFHIIYLKWQTTWSMNCRFKTNKLLPYWDKKKWLAAKANRFLGCQVVSGGRYTSDTRIGVSKVTRGKPTCE